ncbi:MAG: hypothetical protein Q7R95_03250, partial [bacterium]|nr:hypothetical protein [bacterium]
FSYIQIMIRKVSIYLSGFIILLLINGFFIFKLYRNLTRANQIQNLLSEISHTNNNSQQFQYSVVPLVVTGYQAEIQLGDARIANLKTFFRKYNSPLYDVADVIVKASDTNQFDYRLLPAIAMQESNLCKYIPENSFNCWGWGIYGDTVTRFESYEEAINTVSRGIKKNYIDKGLITATTIMEKYTPSSNGSWAHGVNTFLRALE